MTDELSKDRSVRFSYTNYRGETANRWVAPIRLWFGVSEYHTGEQWFMKAYDFDKAQKRDFALADCVFNTPTPAAMTDGLKPNHVKERVARYARALSPAAPQEGAPEFMSEEEYTNAVNDLKDFWRPSGVYGNCTICNGKSATLGAKALTAIYEGDYTRKDLSTLQAECDIDRANADQRFNQAAEMQDAAIFKRDKRIAELEAANVAPKMAPVQGFTAGIPWEMHLRAYDAYCIEYRPQQALIEGGCRGGFGVSELDRFIPKWRDELSVYAKLATARNDALEEAVTLSRAGWTGADMVLKLRALKTKED